MPIGRQRFSLQELMDDKRGEHALARLIREMIQNRQAVRRRGEPAYRPIIRFEVNPEGLRIYHLAFGILEPLGVAMIRHNIEPPAPDLSDYYRKN